MYKAVLEAILKVQPEERDSQQIAESFNVGASVEHEVIEEAKSRNPQVQRVSRKRLRQERTEPPFLMPRVVESFVHLPKLAKFEEIQNQHGIPVAFDHNDVNNYIIDQRELLNGLLTSVDVAFVERYLASEPEAEFIRILTQYEASFECGFHLPKYGASPNLYLLLLEREPKFRVNLVVVNPS